MHNDKVRAIQHILQRVGIGRVRHKMVIHLVRHHQHMLGQAAHQLAHGFGCDDCAGRVVGIADHDQARLFGYSCKHCLWAIAKGLGFERHIDHARAQGQWQLSGRRR